MQGKGGREAATEGRSPTALGSGGRARRGGQVGGHDAGTGLVLRCAPLLPHAFALVRVASTLSHPNQTLPREEIASSHP